MGDRIRVVRVLGVLEPGGAQLSALTLSAALSPPRRRDGASGRCATPPGLELAARYGFAVDAFRVGEEVAPRSLQWTRSRCSPSGLVPARAQTWCTPTWWGPGGLRPSGTTWSTAGGQRT